MVKANPERVAKVVVTNTKTIARAVTKAVEKAEGGRGSRILEALVIGIIVAVVGGYILSVLHIV